MLFLFSCRKQILTHITSVNKHPVSPYIRLKMLKGGHPQVPVCTVLQYCGLSYKICHNAHVPLLNIQYSFSISCDLISVRPVKCFCSMAPIMHGNIFISHKYIIIIRLKPDIISLSLISVSTNNLTPLHYCCFSLQLTNIDLSCAKIVILQFLL